MKIRDEYYLEENFAVNFISEILEYEGSSFVHDEIVYVLIQKLTVGNKSLTELFELLNLEKALEFVIELAKNERNLSENLISEINRILLIDILPGGIYRTHNNIGGVDFTEIQEQMSYLLNDFLNSDEIKSADWFFENFMEIKPFNYRNLATAAIIHIFISLKLGDIPKLLSEI
ncbi:hypothetical protein [Peptoniphilus indolicus]|uniref:Huntingtin interacting protein E family protein n=2 Tax=Peptoniphilus indolicus TaxID=33030 RepID=G4D0U1_9FIRM|nr:hypothetical protein [Peptoniphilus indolicus]EGY80837.1 huntingtin interacting protein E family protein [Peptoniphilus indolicus ATCC 29427]SUB74717.1 Uncharacterised protein [Peptoniphilus indolicus]